MFSPVFPFQRSGRFCCSAIPDACGPRNDGQLPLPATGFGSDFALFPSVLTTFRGGRVTVSVAGIQVLRSIIMRRTVHVSSITSKLRRVPSTRYWYRPVLSQPPGPPDMVSSISVLVLFQLPFRAGQPWPCNMKVPPGSKRAIKAPNFMGVEGSGPAGCWAVAVWFNPPAVIMIAASSASSNLIHNRAFIFPSVPGNRRLEYRL